MTSLKTTIAVAIMALSLPASAQKGKKKEEEKERVPVFNYVIDDPMDVFGRQPIPPDTRKTILLPDFCFTGTKNIADTTLKLEYNNSSHNTMLPDTLSNHQLLRYVSLIKTYTDHTHTYKDATGKLQPLPVQRIIHRYDKTSTNKWLCIDYSNGKPYTLTEYSTDIVRTDSTQTTDPVLGNKNTIVYQYYRTARQ